MQKIGIIIVDDHKILRQGIASIIKTEKDLEVQGEAENLHGLQKLLQEKNPDLVLMDIDLGADSGIKITRWLREHHEEVKILALSVHGEEQYIIDMLEAGATGYLLKNTGIDELLKAIRTVAAGDTYLGSEISATLVRRLHTFGKESIYKDPEKIPLTTRELEVLKLIAAEYSNSEIAEKLYISIRTVDTHRRNLLEKLQVRNTAGLVKYAIRHNLLD